MPPELLWTCAVVPCQNRPRPLTAIMDPQWRGSSSCFPVVRWVHNLGTVSKYYSYPQRFCFLWLALLIVHRIIWRCSYDRKFSASGCKGVGTSLIRYDFSCIQRSIFVSCYSSPLTWEWGMCELIVSLHSVEVAKLVQNFGQWKFIRSSVHTKCRYFCSLTLMYCCLTKYIILLRC
jgi:hypothetical protein